jgi:8-oxo-dGTP pyrophosphatase MutT (NUDIX family)
MDIGVNCEKGTFKLRSCGVIVKGGKMLVDKARRFDGFVFLGGHVQLGENSRDAIIREAKEELGFDVEVKKLICINENIYPLHNQETVAHEVSYYYELEPNVDIPDEGFDHQEFDHGVDILHKYSWVDISKAKENNVRPDWLANLIINNAENQIVFTDQTK